MAKKRDHKKKKNEAVSLVTLVDPTSPVAEQYRTIRTNIKFASSVDQQIKTLVVTSSGPDEGKSFVAANLAVAFAKAGQKVLLVDDDMRKPTMHRTFQLPNQAGLSTVLSTEATVAQTVQHSAVENLDVLTSGPRVPNPAELIGSYKMEQVIQEVYESYDFVMFDLPPVATVTDAQIVASKADGTILVVRENVTRKDALNKAKELLTMAQARILGVVYNGADQSKDEGYYYYYSDE